MSGESERPDDVERRRRERTLGPDEQTLDGSRVPEAGDDTEAPTGEVDLGRGDATHHEGAAASLPPGAERGEDQDTLAEGATLAGDSGEHGGSQTIGDDDETMVGDLDSEAPTGEIELGREAGTEAGGFAGTRSPGRGSSGTLTDEDDTVYEAGGTQSLRDSDADGTRADPVAGTGRRGHVRQIDPGGTRGVSATARDAAAAGYTERGGRGAAAAAPARLAENEPFANRYTLVKRLGKGGMGEVWKARHNTLQGDFAIKVIKASISRDPSFRKRFVAEGQTMMRIKHPGVVEVTDLDQTRDSGELFMVMQYLQGRTLYDAIRDERNPLGGDVRNAVRVFRELADGMQVIHDQRIVHKDLKSDNALLVTGDDGLEHPKVIDFGLAKRMEDPDADVRKGASGVDGTYEPDLRTTLSGTLAYMAPEQFRGKPSSFQSDIYAFGVMVFECFTQGQYPLPRGGLSHYMQLHSSGKAQPQLLRAARPDLPSDLVDVIDRCMAPEKEARPASFHEVAAALQWWLDAPERAARRKRVTLLVGAAVLLVGIAVAGWMLRKERAAVTAVKATAAGRIVEPVDGVVHLGERGLAALEVGGRLTGTAEQPWVEIDGQRVPATFREELGSLVAVVDASGLPDGQHDVVLMAGDGAAPGELRIALDRRPPGIRAIEVPGARDGYVASQSPEVRVTLDEPTIAAVVARVVGRDDGPFGGEAAAGASGPRDRWVIRGTAAGDGPCRMEVEVRDLAGNVTTQDFTYVRDTVLETPAVADLAEDPAGGRRLQVRSALGATLSVRLGEPGRAELRAAGASAVERTASAAGVQEFPLPAVPDGGYEATLLVEDVAGNEQTIAMRVVQVADEIRILAIDGSDKPGAVKGDRDVRLALKRSYALEPGAAVLALRVRDADGNPVREAPRELPVRLENATPLSCEVVLAPGQLTEGTWRLSPVAQGQSEPRSYDLTVDGTRPLLHRIVVRDGRGNELADGAWSLTRDVVVEVEAEDLALASLRIEGFRGPDPAPGPGRRVYRFERTFDADIDGSASVTAADAAGNLADRSFAVRVDTTDPVLALTSPRNDAIFNDREGATFAGTCSEAPFTLHVAGDLVEGGVASSAQNGTEFTDGFPLRVGAGVLRVWATDRAGRRSPERAVRVTVKRLEVELPDTYDWTWAATSVRMEKVREGAIVIQGRGYPVRLSFVDRHEVTNAQYRAFLAAVARAGDTAWRHPEQPEGWDHTPPAATWQDPEWGRDERPVVNVAYWDAYAYARWSGRRLPTEAEWVKAAAMKEGELDLRRWPTGNDWQDGVLVTQELVAGQTFQGPVSALAGVDVSPIGCLHMGGNVSEWVDLERVPAGDPETAVRGGNWYLSRVAADVRTVPAKRYDRSLRAATIGFRCAVDADVVRGRAASR